MFRAAPVPAARRIDEREAEEMLQGISTSADRAELLRLLAHASAPPHVDELTGVDEVLAAFRDAHDTPTRPVPVPVRRRLWGIVSRALTVKVVAGVGILALGGAAVAAGTGHLPAEVQHGAHNLLSPLGVPVPDKTTAGTGTPRGTASHVATPPGHTVPPPNAGPSGPAALSPMALCQAWKDAKKDKHGNGMDPEARQILETLAGGPNRIRAYCTRVMGSDPGPDPTPVPTPTPKSKPDPHPSKPQKSKHPAPTHSAKL